MAVNQRLSGSLSSAFCACSGSLPWIATIMSQGSSGSESTTRLLRSRLLLPVGSPIGIAVVLFLAGPAVFGMGGGRRKIELPMRAFGQLSHRNRGHHAGSTTWKKVTSANVLLCQNQAWQGGTGDVVKFMCFARGHAELRNESFWVNLGPLSPCMDVADEFRCDGCHEDTKLCTVVHPSNGWDGGLSEARTGQARASGWTVHVHHA